MDYLRQLQQKYPDREFQLDEHGRIGFPHDGMFIVDPTISCCGRFEASPPSDYDISWMSAMLMVSHNQCIKDPNHD